MMSGVRNLKQAIMPILWLNSIFCMGIFEIPINRPRYFLSGFYVILMLTGYSILFYKTVYIFVEEFIHEFTIFYLVMGVNILVATLAIILFWMRSENINILIKRQNMAESTLHTLGIKTEYRIVFCNVMYFMGTWIIGAITTIIVSIAWTYYDVESWTILFVDLNMNFPILINSVVDITFVSFIKCLQIKFQKTNTLVNNVVLCANESNTFKIHRQDTSITFVMANYKNNKDKILHLIQTLRHLHLELTRIGRFINDTYCLQLLLELAVHFTMVTATTYCLLCAFSGKLRVAIDNGKILAMILTGCIYSFKIILVNNLCTNVATEAYKTGEIIQSFEGSIIDDDMREEIHQFTQQIVLNSLTFTATGFFTIDNILTGKFFATVVTYVVILIQMNPSV